MKKQKSSSMKMDDEYTSATKRLIKKTLIGMGVVAILLLMLAFWVFKKITTPKVENIESPSPSVEAVESSTTPSPLESASPSPSSTVSPSPTITASPSPTPTKSPSPTPSPTISPSGNSPTPAPTSGGGKTLSSQAMLDGFQASNGSGSATTEIKVGRNAVSTTRGFISFDITQLPPGTSIDKVTLRIYQQSVSGAPYSTGGDLKIDQLNYGSTFESSDYSTSSISSSFATISSGAAVGWKEIDVTQNVRGDLTAGRLRSQFRLHFSLEQMGGNGEYALFESGDNALKTGNTPQLVIITH